jgi:hypothetical protein
VRERERRKGGRKIIHTHINKGRGIAIDGLFDEIGQGGGDGGGRRRAKTRRKRGGGKGGKGKEIEGKMHA